MIEASQAAAARRRVFDRVAEEINVRLFAKDEVLIWDLVAHELADALREWGGDGAKRLAVDEHDLPLHRSPFYMHEDADTAADLIDPEAEVQR